MARSLARAGRVGLIESRSRICCDSETRDGSVVTVDYFPEMVRFHQYSDCRRFRAEFGCQFINDSDTQIVYTQPALEFWGVEGLRLLFSNPQMFVYLQPGDTWQDASAITVPAHSVVGARIEVPIAASFREAEEAINDTYGETVVLLRTQTIEGKAVRLRLCASSIAGQNKVTWPHDKKFPIFNIYSLNRDGRNAGRHPQQRKAKEMSVSTRSSQGKSA